MSLEEISFRNQVEWYADELRQIAGGALSSRILTRNTSIVLFKYGVLERIGNRTIPSVRAMEIMERT